MECARRSQKVYTPLALSWMTSAEANSDILDVTIFGVTLAEMTLKDFHLRAITSTAKRPKFKWRQVNSNAACVGGLSERSDVADPGAMSGWSPQRAQ